MYVLVVWKYAKLPVKVVTTHFKFYTKFTQFVVGQLLVAKLLYKSYM